MKVSTRTRTGAQILCEALIRNGVDLMFGIPGGAIMPFYHAMWEYRDSLRHVLCRHEQGAGHAAEGYARVTGRVGVCVGTSGPGATNLVTPIADAYMDSVPLLALTGQVSSALLGTDAFQETDITGITLPITKHNYLVTDPRDIPRVIAEAIHIATSGRPGPVLVDVTKDCQLATIVPEWNVSMDLPGYVAAPAPNPLAVARAADMIAHSARPMIIAGQGVIHAGATSELLELAELAHLPIATTLHGLGSVDVGHPRVLGMAGMHGYAHVNRAIQQCDLLVGVGLRFDDRVTGKVAKFAPNAKVIHVDVDRAELGKLVPAALTIHADARLALRALIDAYASSASVPVHRQEWSMLLEHLVERHRPASTRALDGKQFALPPRAVYAALDALLMRNPRPARVVTDVGQHQMWAAQLLTWRAPRTHITSGGAGTMGFAVPAALGIALACPDETICVVCGDGGFQMTNQEMATIVQEGLRNVKIVVVNNGYLGMVRQWQQLFEGRRYSGTPLSGPDFAHLARAYGWWADTVCAESDISAALEAAFAHDGPALLDCRVEREANVWPIVPAGKALDEMMLSEVS